MAISDLMGQGLLGHGQDRSFRDAQAARQLNSAFNQLGGLGAVATTTSSTSGDVLIYEDYRKAHVKPEIKKTLRAELQAEADEWLPKLAA